MKLMQLNAWMGRLTPQIVQLIEAEQPDILTTQEVFDVDGPVIFPDNMFDCFKQIKAAGGFDHAFFAPLWSIQASHQTATFGNAIFSKFPISRQEIFFTSGAYNPDLTPGNRVVNTRNAQLATLDIRGHALCIVNHHGHWEITPEGSDVSVEKMRLIREKITRQTGPLIFAGDLNLRSTAPALQLFNGLLEDLTATYAVPSTLSILGKVQGVACDHIMVNKQVVARDFRVVDELVSDHKALILEFDV